MSKPALEAKTNRLFSLESFQKFSKSKKSFFLFSLITAMVVLFGSVSAFAFLHTNGSVAQARYFENDYSYDEGSTFSSNIYRPMESYDGTYNDSNDNYYYDPETGHYNSNPTPKSRDVLFFDYDLSDFCPAGYQQLGGPDLRFEYDLEYDTNNKSARLCLSETYLRNSIGGYVTPQYGSSGPIRSDMPIGNGAIPPNYVFMPSVVFLDFDQNPSCPNNYQQLGGSELRFEYDYGYDTDNKSGRFCVRQSNLMDWQILNYEDSNYCPPGYSQLGGDYVRFEYDYGYDTDNKSARLCFRGTTNIYY